MMHMMNTLQKTNDCLEQAQLFWQANQPREAGRLIWEHIPVKKRVEWATRVLSMVVERTGITSAPVNNVLQIANNPAKWRSAHDAFSMARSASIALSNDSNKTPERMSLRHSLCLAEIVAKITYNATNPPDEFDEDNGERVRHQNSN